MHDENLTKHQRLRVELEKVWKLRATVVSVGTLRRDIGTK